jgi:hypothetical protein
MVASIRYHTELLRRKNVPMLAAKYAQILQGMMRTLNSEKVRLGCIRLQ